MVCGKVEAVSIDEGLHHRQWLHRLGQGQARALLRHALSGPLRAGLRQADARRLALRRPRRGIPPRRRLARRLQEHGLNDRRARLPTRRRPTAIWRRWDGRFWRPSSRSQGARLRSTRGTRTLSAPARSTSNTTACCFPAPRSPRPWSRSALVALAARLRRWPIGDYLGLTLPSGRETAIALALPRRLGARLRCGHLSARPGRRHAVPDRRSTGARAPAARCRCCGSRW